MISHTKQLPLIELPINSQLMMKYWDIFSGGKNPYELCKGNYTKERRERNLSFFIENFSSELKDQNFDEIMLDLNRSHFHIKEKDKIIQTDSAGLLHCILSDKLKKENIKISEEDIARLINKNYSTTAGNAKEIKQLTSDGMHAIFMSKHFVGEEANIFEQGGILTRQEIFTAFIGMYRIRYKPMFRYEIKKINETLTTIEFSGNTLDSLLNSSFELTKTEDAEKKEDTYFFEVDTTKSIFSCSPEMFSTMLKYAESAFQELLKGENQKINLLFITPLLIDADLRKNFITWHITRDEKAQEEINQWINDVCIESFKKKYFNEFIEKKSRERSILLETFYQVYDIENKHTLNRNKRNFSNYFLGFPDPVPEDASKKVKTFRKGIFLLAILSMPLTLILKVLKLAEVFFKLGEVVCDRSQFSMIRSGRHVFGSISSIVRCVVSFNPIKSIKECSADTARPVQFFRALGVPRIGKAIGGFFSGLLSVAGVLAMAVFAPLVILSFVGMVASQAVAAVVAKELLISGSYTAFATTTGGTVIASEVAAKTTAQICQRINIKPQPKTPSKQSVSEQNNHTQPFLTPGNSQKSLVSAGPVNEQSAHTHPSML
jgi:hypothetical protein